MLAQQTKKKKTGLQVNKVSKGHWSVGGHIAKTEGTRLVVTFLYGKGLLASDLFTGKSDPICFIWCGPSDSNIPGDNMANDFMAITDINECTNIGILRTKVCPTTLEPIWNEDIIFPLAVDDIYSLSNLRCIVYVRDEDIDGETSGNNVVSYDDLGMCEFSLKDILINGKTRKQSIVNISKQLNLISTPKMRKKAEGYIKITCTLIFDEAESKKFYPKVADGIKTLDNFLSKFQDLLRDRNEKENGSLALWGRVSSPQSGSRRSTAGDIGFGTGEFTGQITGRLRSPLAPQIAPKISTTRTVAPKKKDEEGGEKRGRAQRPSMVPRLNCNGLEDVIEGKEGDGEGDDEINTVRGRIIEYLNEKENEDTDEHDSELHILPEYTPIADYIREDSLDGDLGGREVPSTTLNNPTISITSPLCLVGAVDSKEYEHPNIMREEIIEEEILLQKAATRHAAPSSGCPKSSISVSGNDHEHWAIRGNATVAAKALRDVQVLGPLNQKQHDIEYLSSISEEGILKMSQLLAMEMGKNDDNIDTGNSEISSGRQRRGPSGTKLRTLEKVKELTELPSTQNIPNKLTCARPTLKQFKQEQLVGRRQLKEVEFPKARGAPYTDLGTDNRNMPAMELLLKAPHGDVIRATLGTEEMNVMPSPSYIWKDKDKDNERGRQSEVLLMMQGDHDSPEPSISLSPSPIVSVPLKDIEEASTDKNGNNDGLSLRKALSLHVLDAADLVAVKSATLASLPNQILPPACNRKILGSSSGSSNRNNLDWDVVQRNIDVGDVLSAFSVVLERGELEDLARIMEILGPKPHLLSLSIRNKVFEGIATILYRSQSQTLPRYRGNNSASTDREDRLTKRCLFWVLALLQGNKSGNRSSCSCGSQNGDDTHTDNVQGDNPDGSGMRTGGHTSLAYSLSGNTMRDLKKSLEFVSRDKSKKGLLAALLVHYF